MAKRILITGAKGFIGRNLIAELSREPESFCVLAADIDTTDEQLRAYLLSCDFVVHLAGVNRPQNTEEFTTGNSDFTKYILDALREDGRAVPVAMTSSIQAELDNPYGKSKLAAEKELLAYGNDSHAPVYCFRLPNVFGKWCRPNYNSAIATFCFNIANGLPITVSDPANRLTLVYIDDVLTLLKRSIAGDVAPEADGYCSVPLTMSATLGEITDKLYAYRASRADNVMPQLQTPLDRALYSTYLSYLAPGNFAYQPLRHEDDRGLFAEFFKTSGYGQFSVSTTKPGIVRGNHWHHTKVEKFLVVSGEGTIRFRRIDDDQVMEYFVRGDTPTIVDIPPGYTHALANTSETETLVTVIWANEQFDPDNPDTFYLPV